MKRALWLSAVLACAACGAPGSADGGSDSGTGGSGGGDAGSTTNDAWLTAHNTRRAAALPAPSPALPALSWNASAAATAQAYAEKCQFVHNPNRGTAGENLFAASGAGPTTPDEVVGDWVSEVADYTYATNTCAAGRVCGHYTQVVWRATTSVGCGRAVCTVNSPFGGSAPWEFEICDYVPPGNIVGQKPY